MNTLWFWLLMQPVTGGLHGVSMLLSNLWLWAACLILATSAQSTEGILDLVQRRLPDHVNTFEFQLLVNGTGNSTKPVNDNYNVSSKTGGKILVEGNSLSALASG